MKKVTIKVVAFGLPLLALLACSNQSLKGGISERHQTSPAPQIIGHEPLLSDTVPYQIVETQVRNYGYITCGYDLPGSTVWPFAFTIPIDDIAAALKESKSTHVRTYMAYDTSNAFAHMYVVPIDTAGHEIQGIAFDLIMPCPNTCDTTSDLYAAFQQGRSIGKRQKGTP